MASILKPGLLFILVIVVYGVKQSLWDYLQINYFSISYFLFTLTAAIGHGHHLIYDSLKHSLICPRHHYRKQPLLIRICIVAYFCLIFGCIYCIFRILPEEDDQGQLYGQSVLFGFIFGYVNFFYWQFLRTP